MHVDNSLESLDDRAMAEGNEVQTIPPPIPEPAVPPMTVAPAEITSPPTEVSISPDLPQVPSKAMLAEAHHDDQSPPNYQVASDGNHPIGGNVTAEGLVPTQQVPKTEPLPTTGGSMLGRMFKALNPFK